MCSPDDMTIGRTLMPGLCMSSSTNVMPRCGLGSRELRTSANIQFETCACVVQIFEPVQIRSSPSSIADICSDARSEEHTSELKSLMRISYAVFCLKKKKKS